MRGWRIPEGKRSLFKEPLGSPVEIGDIRNANMTVTVGDVVSLTVREAGIVPLLAVYDGLTERREMTGFAALVERLGLERTDVSNPAGMITCELEDAVRNAFRQGSGLIRVEGEEDLALMPVIRHAPDGAMIVYGWPGKGMMAVRNDEAVRTRIKTLWREMEEIE